MTGEIKSIRVHVNDCHVEFHVDIKTLDDKRETIAHLLTAGKIYQLLRAFNKRYVDQLIDQPVIVSDKTILPDEATFKEMTEFEDQIFGDYEYLIERVAFGWKVEENDEEYGYTSVGIWPTYELALEFVKSKGDY